MRDYCTDKISLLATWRKLFEKGVMDCKKLQTIGSRSLRNNYSLSMMQLDTKWTLKGFGIVRFDLDGNTAMCKIYDDTR